MRTALDSTENLSICILRYGKTPGSQTTSKEPLMLPEIRVVCHAGTYEPNLRHGCAISCSHGSQITWHLYEFVDQEKT